MHSKSIRRLSRLIPAVLSALAAVTLPSAAHAASGCVGADRSPVELGAPAVRATTLCLLNAERDASGMRPLRQNAKLTRAAQRHSRDMVTRRYFAHDSLSGASLSTRVARTGWTRSRRAWALGENLAWGSGALATPQAIVAAWMDSPAHRENILQRRFRVIGIGVQSGVPTAAESMGATYTTDFGS